MPSLSIVLTTFNGATFLPAQLQSLATQHRLPDELVIVDDGSSDATIAIIHDFSRQAPFPLILHQNPSRLGWRGNFIRAASLCRHALIAFCDQDDVWYPHKLVEIESLFSDPETLLVHHNADLVDRNGDQIGHLHAERAFPPSQERLGRPTVWANPLGLTMTFRRSLLAFTPFWPRSVDPTTPGSPAAHDQFFYWLAINLGTVRYLSQPLVAYRQHGNNAVGFRHDVHRSWREKLAIPCLSSQARVLSHFCDVLAAAQAQTSSAFGDVLAEALEQNLSYLAKVEAGERIRAGSSILQRARDFAQLLQLQASGSGRWHLGRKTLLTTGVLGVLFGR